MERGPHNYVASHDNELEAVVAGWTRIGRLAEAFSGLDRTPSSRTSSYHDIATSIDPCLIYALARSIYFSHDIDDEVATGTAATLIADPPCLSRHMVKENGAALDTRLLRTRALYGMTQGLREAEPWRPEIVLASVFIEAKTRTVIALGNDARIGANMAGEIWAKAIRWTISSVYSQDVAPSLRDMLLNLFLAENGRRLRSFVHPLYQGNLFLFHDILGRILDCSSTLLTQIGEDDPRRLNHPIDRMAKLCGIPQNQTGFLKQAHETACRGILEYPDREDRLYFFDETLRRSGWPRDSEIEFCMAGFTDADPFPYRVFNDSVTTGETAEIINFPLSGTHNG